MFLSFDKWESSLPHVLIAAASNTLHSSGKEAQEDKCIKEQLYNVIDKIHC